MYPIRILDQVCWGPGETRVLEQDSCTTIQGLGEIYIQWMTIKSKLRNKPPYKKSFGLASQCRAKQKPVHMTMQLEVSLQNIDVQGLEQDQKSVKQNTD